jgi:hypothetical protein
LNVLKKVRLKITIFQLPNLDIDSDIDIGGDA